MSEVNTQVTRKEITSEDRSRDAILQLASEGSPYIFVTLRSVNEEDRHGVVIAVQTDIDDSEVLGLVLDSAREQVDVLVGK